MNKQYQLGYIKMKTSVYQDTSERMKRQTLKNAKENLPYIHVMYSIYNKNSFKSVRNKTNNPTQKWAKDNPLPREDIQMANKHTQGNSASAGDGWVIREQEGHAWWRSFHSTPTRQREGKDWQNQVLENNWLLRHRWCWCKLSPPPWAVSLRLVTCTLHHSATSPLWKHLVELFT